MKTRLLEALYLGSLLCGLAFLALAEDQPTPKPTKILLLGKDPDHPWGTHMYLPTCTMLTKCLRQVDGVETIVSNGWPTDPKVLEGVSTIVVYTSPAAEILLDGPNAKAFQTLMDAGVGLVTIHWASTVYEKNFERLGTQWMHYLGGTWISNVGIAMDESLLTSLQPNHPIQRGWAPYELNDEFYLNPKIGQGKPLLQVHTKGQDLTVAWVHEREDGGRAFATTLGHFYRNFKIEAFRRMIINGILWTAKVEVPASGAPVALAEEDLTLPPKP